MDVSTSPELKRASSFNGSKAGGTGVTEQEQGDFLAIEDLLDFTNEDIGGSIESCCASQEESPPVSSITVPCEHHDPKESSSTLSVPGPSERPSKQSHDPLSLFDADIAGPAELCVPCDDVAELEWLSNFVEESFSSGDGAVLAGGLSGFLPDEKALINRGTDNKQQSSSPVSILDHHHIRTGTHHSTSTTTSSNSSGGLLSLGSDQLYMSRPGRARTKRCRTAVCFWNTRILSITDDCNILEASSTCKLTSAASQHIQSCSSSDSEGGAAFALGYDDSEDFFPPSKKAYRGNKPLKGGGGTKAMVGGGAYKQAAGALAADGRSCLHCGSQRTPQWRAGPMGPKTLCNACGVRYKSGRLLPEYRPAASPTFVESIHSNSHRRVLEMRRQRGEGMFGGGHGEKQLGVC